MIGLFDSGSGGLNILSRLREDIPDISFTYLGDHSRAPYGTKSEADILKFTIEMTESLFEKGAKLVLLACNTASAIALRDMQENWLPNHYPDRKILGVVVPVVEHLTNMPWQKDNPTRNPEPKRKIGIFATPKTIESGGYGFEVQRRAPNLEIIAQPCPGLVEAIEGAENTEYLTRMVKGFVNHFLKNDNAKDIDTVLLGCTHYPFAKHIFREYLPKNITILSQSQIISSSLKDYLGRHPELGLGQETKREVTFFTTGDPSNIFDNGESFLSL